MASPKTIAACLALSLVPINAEGMPSLPPGLILGSDAFPEGRRNHDVVFQRYVTGESVPLTWFQPLAHEFTQCFERMDRKETLDGVCREIHDAAPGLDFTRPNVATKISQLRVRVWETITRKLSGKWPPLPADLISKIRFLSHLDTSDLAAALRASPAWIEHGKALADLARKLKKERAPVITPDSGEWEEFTPRQKTAFLWELLVPNIREHLQLQIYARHLHDLDSIWKNPNLQRAYRDFRLTWLSGMSKAKSSQKQAFWVERNGFAHKLKNLLVDAVWDVNEPGARPFPLSDYFFNGRYHLAPADSFYLTMVLRKFGKQNQHLAYRIDPADSTTWGHPKLENLDRLAETATIKITAGLGTELQSYLDKLPNGELELVIPYSEVPDLYKSGQSRLAELVSSRRKNNIVLDSLPLAPSLELAACLGKVEKGRKGVSRRLGECLEKMSLEDRGLLDLTFAGTSEFRFTGTYSQLQEKLKLK